MTRLIGRAWVPMVMVVVVAVGAFTVSRLRGVFGSYVSVPDSGTADLARRAGWLPELCGAGHGQREVLVTGALLIGWRKVVR